MLGKSKGDPTTGRPRYWQTPVIDPGDTQHHKGSEKVRNNLHSQPHLEEDFTDLEPAQGYGFFGYTLRVFWLHFTGFLVTPPKK